MQSVKVIILTHDKKSLKMAIENFHISLHYLTNPTILNMNYASLCQCRNLWIVGDHHDSSG